MFTLFQHGGGIPESPLSQEKLEGNEEIEEAWLRVPTDRHHPQNDDNTEPQVKIGNIPLVSDEEEPESDDSIDSDDEDMSLPRR
jgi:hypothetical protein